jgi:hypothetical protein
VLELAGQSFTTGVLTYFDDDPDGQRPNASIYIPINIPVGAGSVTVLVFLDTGAPYFIVGPDVIEALKLKPAGAPATIELRTRLGLIKGFLDSVDLVIPAEEGDSLRIGVTVFASKEWNAGAFLGYSGCMSNMNFAVQPQNNRFFFGPP